MKPDVTHKIAVALRKNKNFAHFSFEEIEDCVQDTVILFLKKAPDEVKADENKTFFWLYSAAILIHKNHAKHEKRNTSLDKKQEGGYDIDAQDHTEIDSENLDMLNYFLNQITEEAALIVRLNRIEGYTLEEIAKHLRKSIKAVEKKYERALKKLSELGTKYRDSDREKETSEKLY